MSSTGGTSANPSGGGGGSGLSASQQQTVPLVRAAVIDIGPVPLPTSEVVPVLLDRLSKLLDVSAERMQLYTPLIVPATANAATAAAGTGGSSNEPISITTATTPTAAGAAPAATAAAAPGGHSISGRIMCAINQPGWRESEASMIVDRVMAENQLLRRNLERATASLVALSEELTRMQELQQTSPQLPLTIAAAATTAAAESGDSKRAPAAPSADEPDAVSAPVGGGGAGKASTAPARIRSGNTSPVPPLASAAGSPPAVSRPLLSLAAGGVGAGASTDATSDTTAPLPAGGDRKLLSLLKEEYELLVKDILHESDPNKPLTVARVSTPNGSASASPTARPATGPASIGGGTVPLNAASSTPITTPTSHLRSIAATAPAITVSSAAAAGTSASTANAAPGVGRRLSGGSNPAVAATAGAAPNGVAIASTPAPAIAPAATTSVLAAAAAIDAKAIAQPDTVSYRIDFNNCPLPAAGTGGAGVAPTPRAAPLSNGGAADLRVLLSGMWQNQSVTAIVIIKPAAELPPSPTTSTAVTPAPSAAATAAAAAEELVPSTPRGRHKLNPFSAKSTTLPPPVSAAAVVKATSAGHAYRIVCRPFDSITSAVVLPNANASASANANANAANADSASLLPGAGSIAITRLPVGASAPTLGAASAAPKAGSLKKPISSAAGGGSGSGTSGSQWLFAKRESTSDGVKYSVAPPSLRA